MLPVNATCLAASGLQLTPAPLHGVVVHCAVHLPESAGSSNPVRLMSASQASLFADCTTSSHRLASTCRTSTRVPRRFRVHVTRAHCSSQHNARSLAADSRRAETEQCQDDVAADGHVEAPRVTRRMLAGFAGGIVVPSLLSLVRLQSATTADAAEIMQLAAFERSGIRRSRDALLVPEDLSTDLSRKPEAGSADSKPEAVSSDKKSSGSQTTAKSTAELRTTVQSEPEPFTEKSAKTMLAPVEENTSSATGKDTSSSLSKDSNTVTVIEAKPTANEAIDTKGVPSAGESAERVNGISSGSGLLSGVGFLLSAGLGAGWFFERSAKAKAEEDLESAKIVYDTEMRNKDIMLKEMSKTVQQEKRSLNATLKEMTDKASVEKRSIEKSLKLAVEVQNALKTDISASTSKQKGMEAELNKVRAALIEKEEALAALAAQSTAAKKSLDSAESSRKSLAAELSRVTALWKEVRNSVQAKEKEMAASIKESASLKRSLDAAEAASESFQQELAIVRDAFVAKESEVDALSEKLRIAVEEARETDKYVAGVKDRLNEVSEALTEEQGTVRRLAEEIGKERAEVELREKEVVVLKAALKDSVESINGLELQVGKIVVESEAKAREWEESQNQIESLEQQMAEEKKAGARLQDELAHERGVTKKLVDDLEGLRAEMENERRVKEDLVEAIEREEAERRRLQDAVDNGSGRIAALERDLRAAEEEIGAGRGELESVRGTLGSELQREKEVVEAVRGELELVRGTLHSELQREKEAVQAVRGELKSVHDVLEREREKLQALEEGMKEASQSMEDIRGERDELREKLAREESERNAKENEIAELRDALQRAEGEAQDLRSIEKDLVVLRRERDGQEERAALLEADMQDAKVEVSRLGEMITETKRALLLAESKIGQIAEVRAEAAMMVEHFEDVAGHEKEEKEKLLLQKESLIKEKEADQATKTQLSTELETVRSELFVVQKSLDEALSGGAFSAEASGEATSADSTAETEDRAPNEQSQLQSVSASAVAAPSSSSSSSSSSPSAKKSSTRKAKRPLTG